MEGDDMSDGARCLTAVQALAADDLQRKQVLVPEWGENACVYVRELSAAEIYKLTKQKDAKGLLDTALIVAASACDATGRLLFTEDQVEKLNEKSSSVLGRLQDVMLEVNAFSLKGAKDAEENSDAARSDDSSTD